MPYKGYKSVSLADAVMQRVDLAIAEEGTGSRAAFIARAALKEADEVLNLDAAADAYEAAHARLEAVAARLEEIAHGPNLKTHTVVHVDNGGPTP